jgi:hypothetical protein
MGGKISRELILDCDQARLVSAEEGAGVGLRCA